MNKKYGPISLYLLTKMQIYIQITFCFQLMQEVMHLLKTSTLIIKIGLIFSVKFDSSILALYIH